MLDLNTSVNIHTGDDPICTFFPSDVTDYSEVLKSYNLNYKPVDYYLQVGEIKQTQGWILHISVVISQVTDLFKIVIPALAEESVPFKVAMNKQTCRDLLHGFLGVAQIGKLISIYPQNDSYAVYLAKKLISLTRHLKGPLIPTDILLGNVIFTRYGSFSPQILQDSSGKTEKYIYDYTGHLAKDTYDIPFQLPKGVVWPFHEIANHLPKRQKKVLNHIYRPISFLKVDARGHVFKGLRLKGIFQVSSCVIKQGIKNMSSEDNGRDIHDRLEWQKELHHVLGSTIPLPKIYDFFQEDGDSYLVMEYISGTSLFEKIKEINPCNTSWFDLPISNSQLLIGYLISVTSIIEKLHKNGYVHRDIVPVNFLLDKKGNIFLIDLELAYSFVEQTPIPPFEFGTAGFMSPEQHAVQIPTVKEDIYGLGALLIQVLTGLSPVRFDQSNPILLFKSLNFLLLDEEISSMIVSCLDRNASNRPDIPYIQSNLYRFRKRIQEQSITKKQKIHSIDSAPENLKEAISLSITGLNKPPVVTLNDLWYSKAVDLSNALTTQHKEYIRHVGLGEGIGGVLYLLARAKKAGFTIEANMPGFLKGWEFIEARCQVLSAVSPGLYSGAAGIALALTEGIRSGLISNNEHNRKKVQEMFQDTGNCLNIANGLAGLGVSLLQCQSFLDEGTIQNLQYKLIQPFLSNQQKNGEWIYDSTSPGRNRSFSYGNSGIIWFLLDHYSNFKNEEVKKSIQKGLQFLVGSKQPLGKVPKNLKDKSIIDDYRKILVTLLKSYEVLQDELYRNLAEAILREYPVFITTTNFSAKNGMAAIGELYLEAYRLFNNEEWIQRANWIAGIYTHTLIRNNDGSGYWKMEENNAPTADFMTGNSGIIHFLIRCLDPVKTGYRFLK